MSLPTLTRAALWMGLGLVAACAAQSPSAPPASEPTRPRGLLALPDDAASGQRVIVLLAQDASDPGVLGERLAAAARVPVRVVRPLTPRRWSLLVQCDGQAACATALDRLAAERPLVLAVEPDPQVQLPPRPKGAVTH